jgi:hypothetical protein
MSAQFILVASYPKSGNTWTRLIFENLARGLDVPVSINDMTGGVHGFGRRVLFDATAPVNASELLVDEIENFMPEVFRKLSAETEGQMFVKIHDFAHRTKNGEWLYPPECVNAVVYLVRHPFDVAVSFASHLGLPLETTVDLMQGTDVVSSQIRALPLPLPQHLGSWSENIGSWLGSVPYRVTMARYEDLHANPVGEFTRLAASIGLMVPPGGVARAVEATKFDRLRKEESQVGFREKPPSSSNFFRSGKPQSWKGALDEKLCAKLARDHATVMKRLGYLEDGTAVPMER